MQCISVPIHYVLFEFQIRLILRLTVSFISYNLRSKTSLSVLFDCVARGLFACCYCLWRQCLGTIKRVSVGSYSPAGDVSSQIRLV